MCVLGHHLFVVHGIGTCDRDAFTRYLSHLGSLPYVICFDIVHIPTWLGCFSIRSGLYEKLCTTILLTGYAKE
jgi:hypothetical protein